MKINKTQLLKALEIVKPGLANKEMIEQSTSFAFLNKKVVTYNDEISISHPVEGLELEGAIYAEELYRILGKLKEEEIEVGVNDSEITMKSGKAQVGLRIQAEITLPILKEEAKWKPLPALFKESLKFVLPSCSRDMSRPILTCINIREEGWMEASDGFRIAKHEMKSGMPVENFLLPASSVNEVIRIEPEKIAVSKGWIHFQNKEGTILSSRTYEESFPDTEKHYQVEGKEIIFPQILPEILERAAVFAKRDHFLDEIITIHLEDRKITIKSESDQGWFKEETNIRYSDDPIQFFITPGLFKDILSITTKAVLGKTQIKFESDLWEYVALLRNA